MWQVVFANVSLDGRVVDSDVYGFFDGCGHILAIKFYINNKKAEKIKTEENKATTTTSAKQIKKCHLTHKAYMRATRTSVGNMVSRYISKEGTLKKPVDVPKG